MASRPRLAAYALLRVINQIALPPRLLVAALPRVSLSKTDDADTAINGREAQHMQPFLQKTKRHVAGFGVFVHGVEIKVGGTPRRQTPIMDVSVMFTDVKLDVH